MRRRRFQILLAAGTLCLAAALCLAGYNIWDEQRATVSASEAVEVLVREIPDRPEKEQPLAPEPQPMMTSVELDERYYVGLLEIPDLELTLPIQREWSDALLHYSPCVYQGTLADGLIIAGHNYRSHFAHLNQLAAGAEIRLRELDGNVWTYTVAGSEIIDGNDVESMAAGDWDLTLFTCTLSRTSRVTVRCERESGQSSPVRCREKVRYYDGLRPEEVSL